MMPSIDIPETTFKRLQALATPFVDTPVSVIERLLDTYEGQHGQSQHGQSKKRIPERSQEPLTPAEAPNLTDTRLLFAMFDGKDVSTPYWNDLVRKVHELAFQRLGNFQSLRRATTANIIDGAVTEKGYKPLDGFGFSIQGVDANEAWRIVYHLARKLGVAIDVEFEWRVTEKAERPGDTARLVWEPQT